MKLNTLKPLVVLIVLSFLFLSSKCKKKKDSIAPSPTPSKTELQIIGDVCFPPLNEHIEIEVFSIDENGIPVINEQYTQYGYSGTINKVGNKLIIPDFDIPTSEYIKNIKRIEELTCRDQPCCPDCIGISTSNRGKPIWNSSSLTVSGKHNTFELEAKKNFADVATKTNNLKIKKI